MSSPARSGTDLRMLASDAGDSRPGASSGPHDGDLAQRNRHVARILLMVAAVLAVAALLAGIRW